MAECDKLPLDMSPAECSKAICEIIRRSHAYPEAHTVAKPILYPSKRNHSDRICMTCRGFGQIEDVDEDYTPIAVVECWRCGGEGVLP